MYSLNVHNFKIDVLARGLDKSLGGSVLKGPQTLFLCEEKKSVHFAAHFNLRLLTVKFVACQPQHIETESSELQETE